MEMKDAEQAPFFLIRSISGKAGYLLDRRVNPDTASQAMRERLLASGCTIEPIDQTERDRILETEDGWQLM